MAQPVLVRSYTSTKPVPPGSPNGRTRALPPVSAFAFADILREADGPEMQSAIDGIAEICAKNRMSLAEEYASHLPPVGEITAVSTLPVPGRSNVGRPAMRRPLTSVPEASSSGSESSRKSRRRSIFASWKRRDSQTGSKRMIRIGNMGREILVNGTTAMSGATSDAISPHQMPARTKPVSRATPRSTSAAASSLRRLLEARDASTG